jgi:crotonobetaine/carnitine-CoA ligase
MMGNHPAHVVLYLALSWIGAVAIELNTHLRRAGIELQVEDSDPKAAIVDAGFEGEVGAALDRLGRTAVAVFARGAARSSGVEGLPGSRGSSDREPHRGGFDRLLAISYTSGTTGRPKGVMLTERYFQIGAKNAALLADARDGDVLFLWEPFYHFAAWMTVVIGLQRGLPIALVERFSASQCWDQIRRSGATLFHYLGGALNILLKQPPRPDDRDNPIRIAWGAAAPAASWRLFEERFGVRLREGYGISEAQNFTHLNLEGRVGSIGRPTEEFASWIEGEDGRVLGPGEIGEIVLRPTAPGIVMAGYFGDPERTREVLRNGCVYTGDLGYRDGDGCFYYAGRKKDSLRRRGENVSAWEVERVINAHPAVEESAVVGVASAMGEQDIRAFVKLAPGSVLDPLDLIRWCEQDLAHYQIPRYVDFVEEFPRGPTQRIRKGDLPVARPAAWDLEASGYPLRRRG